MPKLYKHCEEKHNLAKGGTTLRLGTLEEFKKLDPKFIPYAGYSEGQINITGKNLESIPISKLSHFSHNLIDTGGQGKLTAGSVDITNKDLNCYIFCCSLEVSNGPFLRYKYDSMYPCPEPEEMSQLIGDILQKNLSNNDLANSDEELHYIQAEHGLVEYYDRPILTNENINDLIKETSKPVCFLKPKSHESINYVVEKEYRFCFYVFNKKGIQIAVKEEAKILNVSRRIRRAHFK